MSSQPPMDERQTRKQQIRPRFLDLAEFDDDLTEDASSRRAALESFSNWLPAATVVRKKPPAIVSASKTDNKADTSTSRAEAKQALKATVEEGADTQTPTVTAAALDARAEHSAVSDPASNASKSVRFAPETSGVGQGAASQQSTAKATFDFSGSVFGTIQERPVGERRTRTAPSNRPKPSGSRFVVRRRMDEDLQRHEEQRQARLQAGADPHEQEPGAGFPVVSHRDQIAPILPPVPGKARTSQYSENIDGVEAPQKDTLATETALSAQASASGTTANPQEEEWLDEDGKPMSAFRKSRLMRQGLRPPSVRLKNSQTFNLAAEAREVPTFRPDPTRDPGGGADIDTITAVLSEVSRENDQKLRQMSAVEVSDEIRSLESLFGKDVLDALRNRKSVSNSRCNDQATTGTLAMSAQPRSDAKVNTAPSQVAGDEGGPLAIKRQYFPAEPEGPNPSLEWLMPQMSNQQASTELRFDFTGKVVERGNQTDETYLLGLHHHGDDQESAGYTLSELLHLSRSTVAAQRQLALNVLGRICEGNPAVIEAGKSQPTKSVELLNDKALLLRVRVISIARWMLSDRHFTVRSAALRCLASAIRSLPAGIVLPLGATQNVDFNRLFHTRKDELDQHNDRADASEVEVGIQKDWASVMLESKLVDLFLDKTDSVITSTWEAELALELLLRISSCSAVHATRVFETDPVRICDFIIHIGLKMAWPPVSTDDALTRGVGGRSSSFPSINAVRLLHQGILSDRKIAQSIVMSGNIEHLLRFVLTPPWKMERDWTSNDEEGDVIVLTAYQIYDEVLQLFTSLASYGFFASVVTPTWSYWQESATWAVAQLESVASSTDSVPTRPWLDEANSTAAQRIFEILATWTHSAIHPHELMTAHDITWTQVRDWVEPVMHAAPQLGSRSPSIAAPVFGALSNYIDMWLRCVIGNEPGLLEKYLKSCQMVIHHCEEPVKQNFLKVLRLFSSAPTRAIALDEAEEACRACHRYLESSKTLTQAEQVHFTQLEANAAHTPADNTAVMFEGLALISCASLWQALNSLDSKASGRCVYQQTFSNFVAASVAAGGSFELAAITRLDSRHASRVAQIVLEAVESLCGTESVRTLRPFLLECMVASNRLPEAAQIHTVEHRDNTPLSQLKSLFRSTNGNTAETKMDQAHAEDVDEDGDEEKEMDPITGNKLWKCPASGLPIRADWPLLALDDLLHSANTAVFNRPDNLERDWKPSELEMVRATLKLSVAVFTRLLKSYAETENASAKAALLGSLPSPEQILLGVMKVFMLEKDQPDTFTDKSISGSSQQKTAGILTGRDLFRDSAISSDLTLLLDIADELVGLRQKHRNEIDMSSTMLDAWTASTYGVGMSFYQFFTDLVGLWDSVSFGDTNFARVVMTVANAGCTGGILEGEHGVAVDFRRLVWNDYSDSLRSMPPMKVASWLLSWRDTDEDMLEHYCRYLAGAAEKSTARQSIAWQIAAHHVGAALQSLSKDAEETDQKDQNVSTKSLESILKSLAAARGERLLRELMHASSSLKSKPTDEDVNRMIARLSS